LIQLSTAASLENVGVVAQPKPNLLMMNEIPAVTFPSTVRMLSP
jgi:hypothetical protein